MQMVSSSPQMELYIDIILGIQQKYRSWPVWGHFWTLSDI